MKTLRRDDYIACARQMVAEGCVLMKNENQTLPVKKGDKVAVFGRCAFNYFKSGLGSGGMVNTSYEISILDALKACEDIELNQELLGIYEDWIKENPYDKGQGWGKTPWSQKEMPLTDRMVQIAQETDVAIVIIGRTAGEDQDNRDEEGSYRLTATELDMIRKVSEVCERTVVVFNVGNIVDMKWSIELQPAAMLYAWQGGQEGGNGVVDILMGNVTPCGKLATTVAEDITDYASNKNFGNLDKNYYAEDIYVGYRYFETFPEAAKKVLYPFGYGLSYTTFDKTAALKNVDNNNIEVEVTVKNTGNYSGKEVAIVYIDFPQKYIGKPKRVMAGFSKTKTLAPGEVQVLTIVCAKSHIASYDETGVTGYASAWVLDEGIYEVYVGGNIREATLCGSWTQELQLIEQLEQACAPVEEFERMVRVPDGKGDCTLAWEKCPTQKESLAALLQKYEPQEIAYTGDKGYKLADVYSNKIDMDTFVGQLTDEELVCLFHGEGMCSNRVTPGVASAFGGVTDRLAELGIPAAACSDGPSGIRMDCGTKAFSGPNGAVIASSFNLELAEDLYEYVGLELRKNNIDTLLGPGINIMRHPLNGRNFEYFSEDPLLTGLLCAAQLKGMEKAKVTGTIKHFCANNQETNRYDVESVVSERALREIYLKGFEISVKEGGARSIMTAYNPVNGIWTAGHFPLCTVILRNNWHYDGIVMSDWWAKSNWEGEAADASNNGPMVRAQNDLFMCCQNTQQDVNADKVMDMLSEGRITRAQLQRNAKNILNFLMKTPAMDRILGVEEELIAEGFESEAEEEQLIAEMQSFSADEVTGIIDGDIDNVVGEAGKAVVFDLEFSRNGKYELEITYSSESGELAQLPVSIYYNGMYVTTASVKGTQGEVKTITHTMAYIQGRRFFFRFVFGSNGLKLHHLKMTPLA